MDSMYDRGIHSACDAMSWLNVQKLMSLSGITFSIVLDLMLVTPPDPVY